MKYLVFITLLLLLTGCIHTNIQVNTAKQWEGHYTDTKSFYNSTKDIQLDKNETIWVLSNRTLNTILKNIENKTEK